MCGSDHRRPPRPAAPGTKNTRPSAIAMAPPKTAPALVRVGRKGILDHRQHRIQLRTPGRRLLQVRLHALRKGRRRRPAATRAAPRSSPSPSRSPCGRSRTARSPARPPETAAAFIVGSTTSSTPPLHRYTRTRTSIPSLRQHHAQRRPQHPRLPRHHLHHPIPLPFTYAPQTLHPLHRGTTRASPLGQRVSAGVGHSGIHRCGLLPPRTLVPRNLQSPHPLTPSTPQMN